MKMSKKARSMAAVLAVMALTAGSTMAADLTLTGRNDVGTDSPTYKDITVTATGAEVAASLSGETLTGVTVEGYATSESLNNMAIDLNTADNAMRSDITDLQTQVGENTTNISDLQTTVADQQTQITTVAEQANYAANGVTEHAQAIGELQTQVETNSTNIAGLQDSVADHQEQINRVAEDANYAANGVTQNTAAIGELQTQVETNTQNIGDLRTDVGTLRTDTDTLRQDTNTLRTDVNTLRTDTDTLRTDVNTNTEQIGQLQDQVTTNSQDIGDLRTDVGTLRTDTDALRTDVNANTEQIGELQGQVATNSQDISTLRTDVGTLRTDTDTLRTDVNNINSTVQQHTQDIGKVQTIVGDGVLSNSNASNLTEAVNQNYAQINNNTQAISALDSRVDDLGGEIDQVGAISAALAGLHPLDYDGTGSKFQLSAAMGSYDSSQAAAIGAFYHFNRDVMISLGGATSFDGDHKTAGNLGVTFRIGEGASGKHVSDDVMARLEAMDQKIAALEQENKDLKNVLGTIDTSLSKEFPDVPANHWAYEAVTKLAGNNVVAGYPDGEFHGDRTMTRYEMAEIIYKAMSKGVQVDQKLVEEFKPEMEQVAANQNA